MGVQNVIRPRYDRTEPVWNFLKFFKVIKYWAQNKYKLSTPDQELLFFIYSEGLFGKMDFDKFTQIYAWDKSRFEDLLKRGWIVRWRGAKNGEKALYEISHKGKHAITTIYKKLTGTPVSERGAFSPVFAKEKQSFSDKIYSQEIIKMNKEYRERALDNGMPPNNLKR